MHCPQAPLFPLFGSPMLSAPAGACLLFLPSPGAPGAGRSAAPLLSHRRLARPKPGLGGSFSAKGLGHRSFAAAAVRTPTLPKLISPGKGPCMCLIPHRDLEFLRLSGNRTEIVVFVRLQLAHEKKTSVNLCHFLCKPVCVCVCV